MRHWALTILAIAAMAQTLPQKGYTPVEPLVGDVDRQQKSLRQIESGLYEYGQGSSVFEGPGAAHSPAATQDRRLYFLGHGYIASYDRSQYFDFQDNHGRDYTAQLVPPNTVFQIGLPPVPQPMRPIVPYQIDARVRSDVGAGSSRTISPQQSDAERRSRDVQMWRHYIQARRTQRDAVSSAIDRVMIGTEGTPKP